MMSGLGTDALRKRLELDRVAGWTGSGRRTSESERPAWDGVMVKHFGWTIPLTTENKKTSMCDYGNFYPDPCDNSRMCETSLQGVSANLFRCVSRVYEKRQNFLLFSHFSEFNNWKRTNECSPMFVPLWFDFQFIFLFFLFFNKLNDFQKKRKKKSIQIIIQVLFVFQLFLIAKLVRLTDRWGNSRSGVDWPSGVPASVPVHQYQIWVNR